MGNANNRYNVIISDKTAQMLVHLVRFLARVSESAALKIIEEFNEKAKSLEVNPQRNPFLIDAMIPENRYRKLLFSKRYLLISQIKTNTVYVDAVVDTRQDYSWLL